MSFNYNNNPCASILDAYSYDVLYKAKTLHGEEDGVVEWINSTQDLQTKDII